MRLRATTEFRQETLSDTSRFGLCGPRQRRTFPAMDYKPGDVDNGHVLGSDNQWHPVAKSPTTHPPLADTYGRRFRRRWRVCVVVMAVLSGASWASQTFQKGYGGSAPAFVIDLVVGAAVSGLLLGTVLCLFVAIFKSRAVPTGA